MPDSRKRRGGDSVSTEETSPTLKLSHRLFSYPRKQSAARRTSQQTEGESSPPAPARKTKTQQQQQQQQQRKQSSPAPESPAIGILEGITRGSIANMVLARLGKLNPNELVGPAPSKPPRVDHYQDEDDNDDDDDDDEEEDSSDPMEEDKDGATIHEMDKASADTTTTDPNTTFGEKEEIEFFDSVRPQPPTATLSHNMDKTTYVVHSGPYTGMRAKLHPSESPGYFILQSSNGRVATVHHSQVKKTASGLARPKPCKRIKLTSDDKKLFVEDVKRYLLAGQSDEMSAARQAETTTTALKIAMHTLDPKREVFRPRKPQRRQQANSMDVPRGGAALPR